MIPGDKYLLSRLGPHRMKNCCLQSIKVPHNRPREIFWKFTALWFSKIFGQNLTGVTISGHSERISPGELRVEVGRPIRLRLFVWTFFRLWRIVDLPEIWGFWRFYLEFWVNSWVFDEFCLILDKNRYIWLRIFLNFWKKLVLGEKFLSLEFLSLCLGFSHLKFLSECPIKSLS